MGKTYHKNSKRYDEETSSQRSGKRSKHASGKSTGGMRTLNSYVEEEYEFDDDVFDDEVGMDDEISIQHIKQR